MNVQHNATQWAKLLKMGIVSSSLNIERSKLSNQVDALYQYATGIPYTNIKRSTQ